MATKPNMTYDEMRALAEKLTPDEAISLYNVLASENGWAGTVFQRGDVESSLDREITDDEWAKVQSSYYWHKALPDICTERGWDLVAEAIRDAGLKKDEDEDDE